MYGSLIPSKFAALCFCMLLSILVACGGGAGSSPTVSAVSVNQKPSANFTVFAQASTVNLDATTSKDADGSISGYAWNFGDNTSTAMGVTVSHVYASPGIYTVTLVVTDNQGEIGEKSSTVTVAAITSQATGKINDSGVDGNQCADAAFPSQLTRCFPVNQETLSPAQQYLPTQDGMLGRDADSGSFPDVNGRDDGRVGFSMTKLNSTGQVALTGPATCLKDNITGLIWEVKTRAIPSDLRDATNTYTHFDSTTRDQRGNGVTPTVSDVNASTNTAGYINAVNLVALCGASDWRLPTPNELQGIVDYGVTTGAAVDTVLFAHLANAAYWTSANQRNTGQANPYTRAYRVDFGTGAIDVADRNTRQRVLLVRNASPVAGAARFVVSASDVNQAVDTHTGLIWKRCPEGKSLNTNNPALPTCDGPAQGYSRSQAYDIVKAASQLGGSLDDLWRMPNVKEITSLLELTNNVVMDPFIFPGAASNYSFFTSTPARGSSLIYWRVDIASGRVFSDGGDPYQLWLVRGRALK
jgi:PKD repeat protein